MLVKLTPGLLVEQKLELSCSFRCDLNRKNHLSKFCHTLLCHLSKTWIFNKAAYGASLLNESSSLAAASKVTKFNRIIDMN
jgi:hypothetical protein